MATDEADSLADLPSQVSRILGEFVDQSKTAFGDVLHSMCFTATPRKADCVHGRA